jgi:hypothetical protein
MEGYAVDVHSFGGEPCRPATRFPMKNVSEYRQHAQECRELAKQMPSGAQREQLLEMARTWDRLADERSALVRRNTEVGRDVERDEETNRN